MHSRIICTFRLIVLQFIIHTAFTVQMQPCQFATPR